MHSRLARTNKDMARVFVRVAQERLVYTGEHVVCRVSDCNTREDPRQYQTHSLLYT